MRRYIILFAALPAANAIALANFQPISSDKIPVSCKIPYYAQIPTCLPDDFNNGCSEACNKALLDVAQSVTYACPDVKADSDSLLYAVLNGHVVASLCPNVDDLSTQSTTTESQTSSDASKTSATSSTSNTQSSSQTTSSPTTTTATSKHTTSAHTVPESTSGSATQTTNEAAPMQTSPSSEDSGTHGGPFAYGGNVNANSANAVSGGSMLALVIAGWACMSLG